jgi:hypothetical protein
MSRLYNPFMPRLSFASGLLFDTDGGGGGGDDDGPSAAPTPTVIPTGTTLKTGTVLNSNDDPVVFTPNDGGFTGQNQSTIPNDDKPTTGPSISQTEQAKNTGVYYDAFGNGYASASVAKNMDTLAEMKSTAAANAANGSTSLNSYNQTAPMNTYDEVPSSLNKSPASSTGGYDEIPSISPSSTTGTTGYDEIPSISPSSPTGGYDEVPSIYNPDPNSNGAASQGNAVAPETGGYDEVPSISPSTSPSSSSGTGGYDEVPKTNEAENAGSTYDEDGQNFGESKGTRDDGVDKVLVEKYGWTMSASGDAISPQQLAEEQAGSTYDEVPTPSTTPEEPASGSGSITAAEDSAQTNAAENAGSTYDDGPINITGEGARSDNIDKILIEKYNWTMGPDGDAIAPGGSTAADPVVADDPASDPVVAADPVVADDPVADPVVVNDDDDDGPVVVADDDDLPPMPILETEPPEGDILIESLETGGFPVTINGVVYNTQAELDAAFNNADTDLGYDGEDTIEVPDSSGGEADNPVFVDTNQDGKITSLEQEIANLRAQLAKLTGESTQTTSGMTREEIISAINSAMKNNSSGYDPMSFMNAFGFAMNPSYFGNTIPTYMSENGVYTRRAVKDKDTGETRYVNVPIANGGGQGIGAYRQNRRRGFGSLV